MMKLVSKAAMLPILLLLGALLTGCATSKITIEEADGSQVTATTQTQQSVITKNKDPFEKFNRSILKFNLKADKYVLKPVAKTYNKAVPRPVRNGLRNFFSNLREPVTVLNDLLQGKFRKAGRDTGRFVINTTLGFLGLNDVASHLGFPKEREDFGQTLAVWGVPSGPYLVLPFLGPSNLRDAFGLVPQMTVADPLNYFDPAHGTYLGITRLVDQRAALLGLDGLLDVQPDKYLFLRESYRERRLNQIHDGNPPVNDNEPTEDELLDELLDDA